MRVRLVAEDAGVLSDIALHFIRHVRAKKFHGMR